VGAKFCAECGKPLPPELIAPRTAAPVVASAAGAMPGYAPPRSAIDAPAPAAAEHRSTNGLAVASMVLGIVWIYWIGSILALIFGYIAKGQIKASDGRQAGRGFAIAGIVLGWVGVGFLLLGIAAFILGATNIQAPPRVQ
jgi:hypothetical protein